MHCSCWSWDRHGYCAWPSFCPVEPCWPQGKISLILSTELLCMRTVAPINWDLFNEISAKIGLNKILRHHIAKHRWSLPSSLSTLQHTLLPKEIQTILYCINIPSAYWAVSIWFILLGAGRQHSTTVRAKTLGYAPGRTEPQPDLAYAILMQTAILHRYENLLNFHTLYVAW